MILNYFSFFLGLGSVFVKTSPSAAFIPVGFVNFFPSYKRSNWILPNLRLNRAFGFEMVLQISSRRSLRLDSALSASSRAQLRLTRVLNSLSCHILTFLDLNKFSLILKAQPGQYFKQEMPFQSVNQIFFHFIRNNLLKLKF